ncbi:Small nuclear ribonucleoprotein [Desmophyllum pertusum]|uniref:Small nuclear ribonucleoprotein n=1 Tax=Desmophyllum pertusum TaxID=174260 RepID=A0A9W9Z982_9CNID|nr:Small nuclear ribonucleoprotein [Desmophyllum pertusum]
MCCNVKSIGDRATLNAHNILTKERNVPSDFVDEIRSIMAWEEIPASHRQLRVHLLSQENIKTWIIANLPQVQYLSSLEGASNRLVDFVLSCLQEEKVCHPSGMKEMLKDLLGDETQSFVLNLWKFLAVSITNETNYTNQTSKAKLEGQKEDVDLAVESDPNNPKDTQGDESKSRFEVLAEQRDYKRRRQSYRAKNVHITKRSAVEVMRDLIETQMHVLEMEF